MEGEVSDYGHADAMRDLHLDWADTCSDIDYRRSALWAGRVPSTSPEFFTADLTFEEIHRVRDYIADLRAENERLHAERDWLARSACSCLGTRDCDTYFEDESPERDAVCARCIQQHLDRAAKAIDALCAVPETE